MSLPESYTDLTGREVTRPPASPEAAYPPVDPNVFRLREALADILDVAGEQHARQRDKRIYVFRGRLLQPPADAYRALGERFEEIGYTPLLQREHDEEVVIAVEGELQQRRFNSPWWLHLALLVATIATTTIMGAALSGFSTGTVMNAIQDRDMTVLRPALEDALPFSLTLLLILGVHEMGHYIAARLHGVKVTLPFFVPLPVSGSLGTMGAVIFIKSPLLNRRALFDVGIAGPLAGLVMALPLYVIGLHRTPTTGNPLTWFELGINRVSNPLLLQKLAAWFTNIPNPDKAVFYDHPMALAAWFGVLLTALNLLPLGQFDGGHVSYALLGRRAWPIAFTTFGALVVMGLMGAWFAWFVWAIMGLLTGLRHPPPHDDLTPLGWPRTVIGVITIALFFVMIVPVPFYSA